MTVSRWAILRCRFSDDAITPPSDELYDRLFTGAGIGTSGMVDFFRDMSHGQLDISGSEVFGWFTLPLARADFAGNVDPATLGPGQVERGGLFFACRRAAEMAGVPVDRFDGVVAAMNRGGPSPDGWDGVDLWGAADMRVFCDYYALRPSLLGQEMGHGYSLGHSRRDGSTDDYRDPWDTMSTARAYMAAHPEYGQIGPGLNAVNMLIVRWFDQRRMWRATGCSVEVRVRLRPLHRVDLPGSLAAAVPDPDRLGDMLYFEFRHRSRWDAGIPESCVLVHRAEGRRSYLVPGPASVGRDWLVAGDAFERGDPDHPILPYLRVEVEAIDEAEETCDLMIRYRCATAPGFDPGRLSQAAFSAQVLGAVPVDGGGAIVLPGGQIVPFGPWDPLLGIVQSVASVRAAEAIDDAFARETAQRAALADVVELASKELAGLRVFREPWAGKAQLPLGKAQQPPPDPK